MSKNFLDNRLLTLCLIPLIIGSLTTLSFQPFNLTIINFIVVPIFFKAMGNSLGPKTKIAIITIAKISNQPI